MPSRILRLWNPDAAAWEEVGDSRLTAHLGAADPHAGYVLETLADAKGDLLAASAADTVGRLPLGTDGHVLTADSTQSLGVKWAAAAGGGGAYLPTAGGTMTGTITAEGAAVTAGGALEVVGSGTPPTYSRVYGPSSPAMAPTLTSTAGEIGVRFRVSATGLVLARLRWYRTTTGQSPPASVRIWDSTATGAPLYAAGTPAEFSDTAVGWKEHALPAAGVVALVQDRPYVVSYSTPAGTNTTRHTVYTPVPDAPVVYETHVSAIGTAGVYPGTTSTSSYGLDAAVRPAGGSPTPAQSGAVRLPNGAAGAVVWRDGGDGADLPLTVNASNELTFNGVPLAAGGAYLPLAGGTLTGDLTLSEATPAVALKQAADTQPRARLSDTALAFGPGGSTAPDTTLSRTGAQQAALNATLALTPSGGQPAVSASGDVRLAAGGYTFAQFYDATHGFYMHADATRHWRVVSRGAAGDVQRLGVGAAGTLTVTADAGAAALVTAGAADVTAGSSRLQVIAGAVSASNSRFYTDAGLELNPGSLVVLPTNHNQTALGEATHAWSVVYAQNGAIQPSSRAVKEGITPLDPAAALEAVRSTPAVTFTYVAPPKPPEWYDLPDDPEQAQAVLEQRARAAPLEEAARTQAGFVAEDAAPLFLTGEGQTNPSNSVGVLLAALQEIDRRLTALETP